MGSVLDQGESVLDLVSPTIHDGSENTVGSAKRLFLDLASFWLKDMTEQNITPERLREAAQRVASHALARMGERMNVAFEEVLHQCTDEETEEGDARLRNRTRIVFEWRLLSGHGLKSYTFPLKALKKKPASERPRSPIGISKTCLSRSLANLSQESSWPWAVSFLREIV